MSGGLQTRVKGVRVATKMTFPGLYCVRHLLPLLALAGCLAQTPATPKPPTMVWPPPPATPRIVLMDVLRGPGDLAIRSGFWQRAWQTLFGTEKVDLESPHGLTTDRSGRLFVVDKVLRQVHLFDVAAQRHILIPRQGQPLQTPIDVAIDEERQRIFVSDAVAGVVRIFTLDGRPAGEIRRGALGRPTGLAIHGQRDELLVVDSENASVMRFRLDDLQGAGMFGHAGKNPGQFNAPTALTVNRSGDILVVDTLNHRVQIFNGNGEFLRSFGAAGDAPGYFSRPKAVAVDPDGNIHVVDALFDNVQVFNAEGQLLLAYASPGDLPGQLWLPSAISINRQGRIFIADTYNRRVQVFQYLRAGEFIE